MAATYEYEVLQDSPFLFWRMDETSGTVVADHSGNGRTGTRAGGVSLSGPSSVFDDTADGSYTTGSNAHNGSVARADEAGLDQVASCTYETVFKINSSGGTNGMIANKGATTTERGNFSIFYSGTDLFFGYRTGAGLNKTQTVGAISKNVWHHFVGVIDLENAEFRSYLDGVELITSISGVAAPQDNIYDLKLFLDRGTAMDYWGWIDEFAIFQSKLSQARALAHYNAWLSGAGGPSAGGNPMRMIL